jgi:capsular polysaccharide biosynthesis protein
MAHKRNRRVLTGAGAMVSRMRPWWTVAAVLLGAAGGLVLASVQASSYRAGVSFVVAPSLRSTEPGVPTLTRTAAALVRSPVVARNVVGALGLQTSPAALLDRIDVHTKPGTAIVEIGVRDGSAIAAERTAQQVLAAFEALANARLGRVGGGTAVAVWDTPAGSAAPVGRPYATDALVGAAAGLLLAFLAPALLSWARTARLRRRVPAVTAAAHPPAPTAASAPPALAPPAFAPATTSPARAQAVAAARAPGSPAPARAAIAPSPPPAQPVSPPRRPGRATVQQLEAVLAAESDPGLREEMGLYLEQLRGFAAPDGSIPDNFDPLIESVFPV